jgi:hypothetical protein
MVVLDDTDAELPMSTLLEAPSKRALTTVEVKGQGSPAEELLLPYDGQFLRGEELRNSSSGGSARRARTTGGG